MSTKHEQWDYELQAALRVCFYYYPDTGELGRRYDQPRAKKGPLTNRNPQGDIFTNFMWGGKIYALRANRLAYFLHTGQQPAQVHYIDYDKTNLKFSNLQPKFSREQILAMAPPPIEQTVTEMKSEHPMNVPITPAQAASAPKKAVVNPMSKPDDRLFDEFWIMSYNKGNSKFTERGTLLNKDGEILPSNYTYRDKDPVEQERLRTGWKALLYHTAPNEEDPLSKSQAELDQEAGAPPKYKRSDCIFKASDIGIIQALHEADELPDAFRHLLTQGGES